MKLTGPACTEAMSEAEEARRRERAEDSAGGVRVEREVRQGGFNATLGSMHRLFLAVIWFLVVGEIA